jgi:hypothetical protein
MEEEDEMHAQGSEKKLLEPPVFQRMGGMETHT